MAMRRICDICGKQTGATAYQINVPALLIDNNGRDQKPSDSTSTDVCDKCAPVVETVEEVDPIGTIGE